MRFPTSRPARRPAPGPRPAARHALDRSEATTGPARARRALRAVALPLLLAGLVTSAAPGWASYTIRRGDTLSEIAARYHTSVATLVEVNALPGNGHLIYAGERLRVPGADTARRPGGKRVPVVLAHRVVRGDSLLRIARRYGVPAARIAVANRLPRSGTVRLGEVLRVPTTRVVRVAYRPSSGGASGGASFAGRRYSSAVVRSAAANRAALARRDQPTRREMRAILVSTARRHGVDPNLVLAISWQESGWSMRRVSVANAVGAMQVLPSTGDWISSVVGRRLDLLDARDNATAGVVLLKILTRSAPLRTAVAGYYQGLAGVRANGMYPDTRRYVANVLALRAQYAGG